MKRKILCFDRGSDSMSNLYDIAAFIESTYMYFNLYVGLLDCWTNILVHRVKSFRIYCTVLYYMYVNV